MKLASDLLEQAEHLARREPKRPKQASLRRAASTAYYALFHLLSADVARHILPSADAATRAKLQRLLDHGEMRIACGRCTQTPVSGPLGALLGSRLQSENLRVVAASFLQLQQARHSADYDTADDWTRPRANGLVQVARDAFSAYAALEESEAELFLMALFCLKQLETVRNR